MTQSAIWAAVCVKSLDAAKQRLAPVLSPQRRRGLVLAMLRDVLAALSDTPGLRGIMVITPDPDVLALVRGGDALGISQCGNIGFAASANAASHLAAGVWRAAGIMVVPADIPLVTPADFTDVLAVHEGQGCTVVPSWDGLGSNCVLLSPPDGMGFLFGPDSCRAHLAAAAASGLVTRRQVNARLGLDVDTPSDFARLAGAPCGLHVRAFLDEARPLVRAAAAGCMGVQP